MLQNFSRVLDKSKDQEEEIEQWKQSLTFQSQELTRREMEMEARLEEIEQKEEELQLLEREKAEIQRSKIEAEQIQTDCERQLEEVNRAWDKLKHEQAQIEAARRELEQTSVLDEAQANKMRDLIDRLDEVLPMQDLQEQISGAWSALDSQQLVLQEHWQLLETQKSQAQTLQEKITQQEEELNRRREQLQQELTILEQSKHDFSTQQNLLQTKQEIVKIVKYNLNTIDDLYKNVSALAMQSGDFQLENKVDIQALENMPLGELENLVKNQQKELEKFAHFVKDQEDELTMQYEEIQELRVNLQNLNPFDSLSLETDLNEAEEQFKILDESLIGSRRNLRERQEFLKFHLRILRNRQGVGTMDNDANDIDLKPILGKLAQQKKEQQQAQDNLQLQVQQIEGTISQLQALINSQNRSYTEHEGDLKDLENNYQKAQISFHSLLSSLELYEQLLQPLQESVNELKDKLQNIDEFPSALANLQQEQSQVLGEMEGIINALTGSESIQMA